DWGPEAHAAPWRTQGLCLLLTLSILIADALIERINLSVVYFIPLALVARWSRRRLLFRWATILVVGTYGCYLAKVLMETKGAASLATFWSHLLSYRLLNRTLVAISILAVATLLPWNGHSPEESVEDEELSPQEQVGCGLALCLIL